MTRKFKIGDYVRRDISNLALEPFERSCIETICKCANFDSPSECYYRRVNECDGYIYYIPVGDRIYDACGMGLELCDPPIELKLTTRKFRIHD